MSLSAQAEEYPALPLDILGEVIRFLPHKDRSRCAVLCKAFLPYVLSDLYGALDVEERHICRIMETSCHNLALVKSLQFTYYGGPWSRTKVEGFFHTLIQYHQLDSLVITAEWWYWGGDDDSLYDVLEKFPCQILLSPEAESYRDRDYLYDMPLSSPFATLEIIMGTYEINDWLLLLRHLDASQLTHLRLGWSSCLIAPFVGSDQKLSSSFPFPNLTNLYVELAEESKHILSHFVAVQDLTVRWIPNRNILDITIALSNLRYERLKAFDLFIPVPWIALSHLDWREFFQICRQFNQLQRMHYGTKYDPMTPHQRDEFKENLVIQESSQGQHWHRGELLELPLPSFFSLRAS
ncbi:hypothetical protein DL96DRAFT_1685823 [Flagelloscypha sp. PMI_526]|nr:hypothetical protein DL96DRAFT_1685823 [Flagelloscypha sp. PMI_526]